MREHFLEQVNSGEISPLLMLPNFSPDGQEVLRLTATEAIRMHYDTIFSGHLWLGLIHAESPFTRDLGNYGVGIAEITKVRSSFEGILGYDVNFAPMYFDLSRSVKATLVRAYEIAQEDSTQDTREITPNHLFKALAKNEFLQSKLFLRNIIFDPTEGTKYIVNMKAFNHFKELLGPYDANIDEIEIILSGISS